MTTIASASRRAAGADAVRPSTPTRVRWLAYAGLVAFYTLVTPGARVEAEDGYWFARLIEVGSFEELASGQHTRHVAFLPLMKALHWLVDLLPGDLDTYHLIRGVSVLAMAGAAVLLWSVLERLGLHRNIALAAFAGFALSYGTWRYANESEVYGVGSLLVVLATWLFFGDRLDDRRAVLLGAVAGLAFVMNALSGLPIIAAVGLVLLIRRSIRPFVIVAATTAVVVLGVYGVAYGISADGRDPVAWATDSQPERNAFGPAMVARGAVAGGLSVAAGNIAFAYDAVADQLESRYSSLMVDDDVYAGERAGSVAKALAPIVALALVAGVAVVLVRVLRSRRTAPPGATVPYFGLYLAIWVGVYAFGIFFMEAGAPEVWIGLLPPIWMAVALVLDRYDAVLPPALLATVIALLTLHNLVSGFWVMRSSDVDYNAQKAGWLLDEAGSRDAILTADITGFSRYLTHSSDATVVAIEDLTVEQFEAIYDSLDDEFDRVFVTADVIAPSDSLRDRYEPTAAVLERFSTRIGDDTELVHDDEFGGVYQLR